MDKATNQLIEVSKLVLKFIKLQLTLFNLNVVIISFGHVGVTGKIIKLRNFLQSIDKPVRNKSCWDHIFKLKVKSLELKDLRLSFLCIC
jgi:hypothetical protein